MRKNALKQKKIWNPALFGIRNPLSWNPESSTRNPESTGWNPESKTVMDSLTWGELVHNIINRQSLQDRNSRETVDADACILFKRRATSVLSWLDCSSTAARH